MVASQASGLSSFLWDVVSLAIAIGAAQLAFSWVALAPAINRRARLYRLGGAGLSLAAGIWSVHGISASINPSDQSFEQVFWVEHLIGLLATGASIGAFATLAASAGAIKAGKRRARVPAWVLAACGLGSALVALQVFGAASALPASRYLGVESQGVPLLLAWGVGVAGCVLAFKLFRALRDMDQRTLSWGRAVAGSVLGCAMLLGQHLVTMAANPAPPLAAAEVPGSLWATLVALVAAGLLAGLHVVLRRQLKANAARVEARRALATLSLNDPLTGLPNRPLFEGTLTQAVQQADAGRRRLALLYINLDGFMPINQSLGQQGGDQVLREMTVRLRALVRPHMAARVAADEFLLLLTGNPEIEDASDLAARVLASIGQPLTVAGRQMSLTCSIGLAMYPEHGAMSTLIGHADAAMRAAKAAGGASHAVFESRMMKGSRDQADLLRDLRLALERGQLELYYQPKIHAPTGEITGAEALMRWHHPQRGMVSPVVFIPLAERYGLIGALGQWVIEEACRQARAWRDSGLRMRVAINLSVHQLRQVDLAERIGAALQRNKINPDLITCELTESAAMDDTEVTMRVLGELAALGLHISIDDFGTGHSSLSYLRKLPAHELKIDRSFVSDLETSEDARKVASAVINLAKALNLKVVAEGVETEAQNRILREFGCDQLQGFLFAKPMSAKALALWAMDDVGPRTMNFRASLFRETLASLPG